LVAVVVVRVTAGAFVAGAALGAEDLPVPLHTALFALPGFEQS
jgi:hypothetical protein